ncbi:hypothetical protein MCOR07_009940 [Pyricularia oryzae]|uniref:Uncharacterized protein n=4 Tax=Pyricularia oryzae TaxID=318829 RepID=G4MX04_PYRO7|nr:uncharacterized protein MGG_15641 [Pyricularia oryzae 70-15]ELQ43014.1 hypothetical protein OOU_Y34scaffold00177g26 [Pyricularia oryzae Y34]KAI6254761.1 hypothetical protein MCOR19_008727 [Pyricularia oryzae]EHA54296.1 hypothetical protein MGG_15641 [Pyricularia oryzae 70-15]KAI6269445.1 hypothetical protein MCOR26_008726 [Pyricularia oryzae]KAI6316772.1 hypothetical protein MCOR30_009234 [Pyricularia oryzae]
MSSILSRAGPGLIVVPRILEDYGKLKEKSCSLVFLSQLSQESLVKRAGTPRSDRVWSACIDLAGMTYR